MKICQVRAELFHAAGQTEMTKLILAFRHPLPNFGKETTNQSDMAVGKSPVALALTG